MTNIMKARIIRLLVRMKKIKSSFNDFTAQRRIIQRQNKVYSRSQRKKSQAEEAADQRSLKKVEDLIYSVSAGGPSGLPQLGALSDAIGRKIKVYDANGKLKYSIGTMNKRDSVNLQYHSPEGSHNSTGHFTLLGGVEPPHKAEGRNMCLYDVVGAQTGLDPHKLKTMTVKIMEIHKASLAHQIHDISLLENNHSSKLCLGGALYNGSSPRDASRYLDDSNGVQGFGKDRTAHPRMHASVPDADENTDCVEKYSLGGWKSGHDSRDEQDFVTHWALGTDKAKRAMNKLNEYADRSTATRSNPRDDENIRQVIHITKEELNLPRDSGAGTWVNGRRTESWPARNVTLVLQHHRGQELNKDYPVHIQTAYPDVPR